MRRTLTLSGLVLALTLATGPAAFASGGTGSGGGGGGTVTDPITAAGGGTPCVSVNSFTAAANQSTVTTDASLTTSYAVSRCGGNNASFDIRISATDATGAEAWTAADTWFPTRNLPYSGVRQTDAVPFGASYQVTLTVSVPGTATVVASATRTASTPAARVAGCATITNMNASGGYAPGSTTVGAIWAGYTVQNCGGNDWYDISMTETNQATGNVDWSYNSSAIVAPRTTTGVGLVDNDYAPTATTYTVTVKVKEHSTGEELASRSLVASTPAAR